MRLIVIAIMKPLSEHESIFWRDNGAYYQPKTKVIDDLIVHCYSELET